MGGSNAPPSVKLHVRLQLVFEGEPRVAPRTDERSRRRVRHQMLKWKAISCTSGICNKISVRLGVRYSRNLVHTNGERKRIPASPV